MGGKLRICILQCAPDVSTGALSGIDPDRKPEVYDTTGEYEWTNVFIHKATSAAQILELATSGKHDVFLNLCDGAWDEDRAGMDVLDALERLNLPYTGAQPSFYEPSKVDMKMAVHEYGVTVPAWIHIRHLGSTGQDAVEKGLAEVLSPPECGGLRFPLIVKHPSGYSSVGMTKKSKVANEKELREQVGLMARQYGGALVEEFIEGREFTVLVVEEPWEGLQGAGEEERLRARGSITALPGILEIAVNNAANGTTGNKIVTSDVGSGPSSSATITTSVSAASNAFSSDAAVEFGLDEGPFRTVAYMPVECVFGPGEDFKHFQLKWHDYDTCSWQPCAEPELAGLLQDAARKTFIATRGVSYGRCDFRVDTAGEVYLLEINANCGMLYPPGLHGSGDYILSLDPTRDHMHFLRTVIKTALQRHRLRQPKVAREFIRRPRQPASGGTSGNCRASGEWGLVAVCPIQAGEVVHRGEQHPVTLASRGWKEVCGQAGGWKRTRFDSYPLSDEVWVIRPTDSSAWNPLTHSCNPNAWMRGLDIVARMDIAAGELVTIDMATLWGDALQSFICNCGASCCRRSVTGEDYLESWLADRYGSHVSVYVAEKRRRAGLHV